MGIVTEAWSLDFHHQGLMEQNVHNRYPNNNFYLGRVGIGTGPEV